MLIPILGIAGSLAAKKKVPASAGTFPVTGPLFAFLLVGSMFDSYTPLGGMVPMFNLLAGCICRAASAPGSMAFSWSRSSRSSSPG